MTDQESIETILSVMQAKFCNFEERGNGFIRATIENQDKERIGWIVFENERYSHIRFHRSSYTFDCTELSLKLENFQQKKELDYYKSAYHETHAKLKALEEKIEDEKKGTIFSKLLNKVTVNG